jgi:23S rRNA (cytidine2498-2'-O)-methyltransferase
MLTPLGFLFVTCQVGAEAAVKRELARDWPEFRFAYSRPGFLTFKLPAGHALAEDFDLGSVFARAYGFSLGRVTGVDDAARARAFWELVGSGIGEDSEARSGIRPNSDGGGSREHSGQDLTAETGENATPSEFWRISLRFDKLHVWQRDTAEPGYKGFENSAMTAAAVAARGAIADRAPEDEKLRAAVRPTKRIRPTRIGRRVVDVVVVEPGEWWVGVHRVHDFASQWPGGIFEMPLPAEAVSRAWLKMEEALRWSQLPIKAGQRCAEIGSAPGGASQALLGRGLVVMGIDPAEMHPDVLAHPNFVHVRKRGAEVRRREFRKVRWLTADMNVPPGYTLDTVESIATHREVNLRGLLLTLKLPEWSLAAEVPEYLQRVRSWGFADVRARQLSHNRQEICVAALRGRRSPR